MKHFLLSFALLGFWGKASAQISLDSTDFSGLTITADSFCYIQGYIPPIALGPNQIYDYTSVAYEPTLYYSIQQAGTLADFPTARFFESRRHVIKDSFYINSFRWSRISAAGLERIGEEIPYRSIALSEFAIPSTTATDSIIIKAQNKLYSQPYQLLQFPCTYGKKWTSTFSMTIDMELNYDFAGFVQKPLQFKTDISYDFEVVGWGKAVVYNARSGDFGEDDVLLLRVKGTTRDSMYFDGAPAPVYLMDYFGFTQGRVSEVNFDELFRARNVSPLVLYQYSGNQFNTPQLGRVQQMKMPSVGLSLIGSEAQDVYLFPNPLGSGQILELRFPPSASGTWSYQIRRIDGMVLDDGSLPVHHGAASLSFPSQVPGGIYWITLSADGETRHLPIDWRP